MQLPRKQVRFDDQVTYLLRKVQVEEGVGIVGVVGMVSTSSTSASSALEVVKVVKGAVVNQV